MLGLRSRSRFRFPITLSASLMAANVTLMVLWIILFARREQTLAVTIGAIAFALILVGLIIWLVMTIKEIRLNHRQANFVDSVTHELKTPIASLQLYLETLKMRALDEDMRAEFHTVMEEELHRLDRLINQLLEVGRLDAIGGDWPTEDVDLGPILVKDALAAADRYQHDFSDCVSFTGYAASVVARPIMMEWIVSNLIDNAFKYGGDPPRVGIDVRTSSGRIRLAVRSNGDRVPSSDRKKIFQVFYRGGDELERRQKGTGLGLYIVSTLVKRLRGRIIVRDPDPDSFGDDKASPQRTQSSLPKTQNSTGTEFVIELPGTARPDEPLSEMVQEFSKTTQ